MHVCITIKYKGSTHTLYIHIQYASIAAHKATQVREFVHFFFQTKKSNFRGKDKFLVGDMRD